MAGKTFQIWGWIHKGYSIYEVHNGCEDFPKPDEIMDLYDFFGTNQLLNPDKERRGSKSE